MSANVIGVDGEAIGEWFAANIPRVETPLHFEQMSGGRSNLTYMVTDAASNRWVLRRPPLGTVTRNAHNVVREAVVLQRLADTAVPVPAVLGVCDDNRVNGAPFFVMGHCDGTIVRDAAQFADVADESQRQTVAQSLVEVLARLHSADLASMGWGGRTAQRGYVQRQLRRWSENWERDRVRVLPSIEHARNALSRSIPPQRRTSVVHGDFRLDNCVIGPDFSVVGVLDWELSTVGDPLADLGQFLVYWAEPGDEVTALENPPTVVSGVPSRAELVRSYREAIGPQLEFDDAEIDFYIAFNWWKTACIVENVYTRMSYGSMGQTDRSPESFGAQAERLAAQAWDYARVLG